MSGMVLLPQKVLGQMTTEQAAKHSRLLSLFNLQCKQIQDVINRQKNITGKDPVAEATPPEPKPSASTASSQTLVAERSSAQGASEVRSPKAGSTAAAPKVDAASIMSDEEVEKHLLAFFSLQDTLSTEAAMFLSKQTRRDEAHIQKLFAKWRSNVRDFIQKLQRSSSGFPTGSHAAPGGPGIPSATTGTNHSEKSLKDVQPATVPKAGEESLVTAAFSSGSEAQRKADAARQEGLAKLQTCINAEGAISGMDSVETLATVMKTSRYWSVREECVKAIGKTENKMILQKLVGVQHLLAMLATWIRIAAEEGQTGFLAHLLGAIGRVPLTQTKLRLNFLDESVLVVKSYKRGQVSKLAQGVLQQWGILLSPPNAKSTESAGGPSKQTLDPTQMAIPLSRPAATPARNISSPPTPSTQRKRSADEGPAQEEARKAKQPKRPVTIPTVKTSRLDASSLVAMSKQNRAAAARHKVESGPRGVLAGYHQMSRRLKQASELQLAREEKLSAQLKVELERLHAHPPMLHKYHAPMIALSGPPPACGEDSTEKQLLASRVRGKAAVKYRGKSQIPASPGEAPQPDKPTSQVPRLIPFHPTNPQEAHEQLRLLHEGGLQLPHLKSMRGIHTPLAYQALPSTHNQHQNRSQNAGWQPNLSK